MSRTLKSATLGLAAALLLSAGAAEAQRTTSPGAVQAGIYKLDPNHGKITWAVTHFGLSTYIGQFAHVEATLKFDPKSATAAAVDVTVDTNSVGTLNPALDAQIKSKTFLDVAAFPTATFKSAQVTQTGPNTADIAGDLTLHGVTRPVVVHATFNQGGPNPMDKRYQLGFAGSAEILRSDFGVKAYLPNLGDKVTLTIEAEFALVPAA
jgi:polyisoprenoid-binding protein YceI